MSHIHLYTTFYNDKNLERQEELVTCINNNIEKHYIATFTVFNEADSIPIKSPKLREIIIKKTLTSKPYLKNFSLIYTQVLNMVKSTKKSTSKEVGH
jgi:hypothetical protein